MKNKPRTSSSFFSFPKVFVNFFTFGLYFLLFMNLVKKINAVNPFHFSHHGGNFTLKPFNNENNKYTPTVEKWFNSLVHNLLSGYFGNITTLSSPPHNSSTIWTVPFCHNGIELDGDQNAITHHQFNNDTQKFAAADSEFFESDCTRAERITYAYLMIPFIFLLLIGGYFYNRQRTNNNDAPSRSDYEQISEQRNQNP